MFKDSIYSTFITEARNLSGSLKDFKQGDSPRCPYCEMEGQVQLNFCKRHRYVYRKWLTNYIRAFSSTPTNP